MAKEFSKSFYSSAAWQKARHAYIMHRIAIDGGLCEVCGETVGFCQDSRIRVLLEDVKSM